DFRRTRSLLDFRHLVDGLRDPKLGPPLFVFAVTPFAFGGYMIALPLDAGARFGWGAKELGLFFTAFGAVAAAMQGWGFGKLAPRFGDRRLAVIGMFGMILPVAIVPWLPSGAWIYGWTMALALANSLVSPALTGLISRLAGPEEQGAMLGTAQGLSALGRFSGPIAYGALYDRASSAMTFLAVGAVMLIAALISVRMPEGGHPPHLATASAAPALAE
ncbi:MAG TPA: MFS transporter, partial [Gemmatimonadales bacterium]